MWGLLICTGEGCWSPVPLEGISVSVAVRGFVAQIKATLRYRNVLKTPMEVMFKCPVDEGSAIYHVEAKLHDRTIIGRCLEKKKAEKVYQEAVSAGHAAVLVNEDERTADIISLAFGNLPPESTAEVTLSLVCDLTVASDGGVQFKLPTLLNPRYNPSDGPTADPHLFTTVGYIMSVTNPYAIDVTATVTGGQSIARIISHTDPINVALEDDSKQAKITLDSGAFRTDHDWSFVVYYSNPYQPHALVESGDSTELGLMKDQVLMINMFPELPEGSYSHYNEVIFIIDRSGSMGGENIQNARAVLLLFLKSLPPGCRFNVISFGSHHTLLFPEGSREYNEANLALALKLHETIDADMGGTEILEPLKTVYSKPADSEYSRQVLLLTDGQVYNVDQITELAERNAGNTRVFAVGIGDGASTALVKGLARAGGGRAELVTQRDRMQTKVMGLVSSMLQSSVRKVSVSCELDPLARLRLVPEVPPTIFAGQHLITYARMPPNTQLKSIKLTGTVDGLPWSASLNHDQVKTVHDSSLALHRLAAKALIRHGYTDDSDGAREELIALSTCSGVLSRYTALVAVDQDGKAFQGPKIDNIRYNMTTRSGGQMIIGQSRGGGMKKSGFFACAAAPPPPPATCTAPGGAFGAAAAVYKGYQQQQQSQPQFGSSVGPAMFCPRSMSEQTSRSRSEDASRQSNFAFAPKVMPDMQFCAQPEMSDTVDCALEDDSGENNSDEEDCSVPNASRTFTDSEPAIVEGVTSPGDVLMNLITCQKFDGSWKLDDVAKTLSVDRSDLQKSEPEVPDESSLLATGLAIVILEEGFSDRKEEWQLLANKAKGFLQQKLIQAKKLDSSNSLKSFLESLKQLLESLRAKYSNLDTVLAKK